MEDLEHLLDENLDPQHRSLLVQYYELQKSQKENREKTKLERQSPKLELIFGIIPSLGAVSEANSIMMERKKTKREAITLVDDKNGQEGYHQELTKPKKKGKSDSEFDEDDKHSHKLKDLMTGKHNILDVFLKNIIISPENLGYYQWRMLVLITSIFSSMMYAMFAAFRYDVDFAGYVDYYISVDFGFNHMNKFTVQQIRQYNNIQIAFELFFVLEMLLGFITEYIDHNNKPVRDFYKIS